LATRGIRDLKSQRPSQNTSTLSVCFRFHFLNGRLLPSGRFQLPASPLCAPARRAPVYSYLHRRAYRAGNTSIGERIQHRRSVRVLASFSTRLFQPRIALRAGTSSRLTTSRSRSQVGRRNRLLRTACSVKAFNLKASSVPRALGESALRTSC